MAGSELVVDGGNICCRSALPAIKVVGIQSHKSDRPLMLFPYSQSAYP